MDRENVLDAPEDYCYTCIAGGRNMLAIRLSPEIEKRLEDLAKKTGRTKTFYVREAITEYIEDLEDIYLAEKRLEGIRSGRSKTIPIEEIMSRYDLEG
jgi:RHH-type rel operon transcriptional repressor/antitoxin RelB